MLMLVMMMAFAIGVVALLAPGVGRLGSQLSQLGLQRVLLLHHVQDLLSGDGVPRSGDDGGHGVVLPQHGGHLIELGFLHAGGAAEDDGAGVLDLVVEELAEVFHIHLALVGVHHGGKAVEGGVVGLNVTYGADHVGQLAHAGGLDKDAVGMIFVQRLAQRLAEIAHQAAADAAGVHLGDVDAGLLQKTAVDADLAELILDEHQLFTLVGFRDELFDQRGFARAEKSGENVDLRHGVPSFIF